MPWLCYCSKRFLIPKRLCRMAILRKLFERISANIEALRKRCRGVWNLTFNIITNSNRNICLLNTSFYRKRLLLSVSSRYEEILVFVGEWDWKLPPIKIIKTGSRNWNEAFQGSDHLLSSVEYIISRCLTSIYDLKCGCWNKFLAYHLFRFSTKGSNGLNFDHWSLW